MITVRKVFMLGLSKQRIARLKELIHIHPKTEKKVVNKIDTADRRSWAYPIEDALFGKTVAERHHVIHQSPGKQVIEPHVIGKEQIPEDVTDTRDKEDKEQRDRAIATAREIVNDSIDKEIQENREAAQRLKEYIPEWAEHEAAEYGLGYIPDDYLKDVGEIDLGVTTYFEANEQLVKGVEREDRNRRSSYRFSDIERTVDRNTISDEDHELIKKGVEHINSLGSQGYTRSMADKSNKGGQVSWLHDMLNKILSRVETINTTTRTIRDEVSAEKDDIKKLSDRINKLDDKFLHLNDVVTSQGKDIQSILQILSEPPATDPVALAVVLTAGDKPAEEIPMGAKVAKASVEFNIQDDGTAVATATPLDKVGNKTTLPDGSTCVATSSDAAIAVDQSGDPSGLTAKLTPSGALATGVVITFTATLPDTTVITGVSGPINVVAGPANSLAIEEA